MRTLILVFLSLQVSLLETNVLRASQGVLQGAVVNGSREHSPMGNASVVLRARIQGDFVAVAETKADAQGRFRFDDLPLDAQIEYMPGANHAEIHYPGPRVRLSPVKPAVDVRLVAYESSTEPNPLVVRQHEIFVRPTAGGLEVSESMTIENPSNFCFVGQAAGDSDRVITLQLSIPPDFEKVTFASEFFGRRFSLRHGVLATGAPWPPGKRQLKFTYVIARDADPANWQRSLDLPSSGLRLTVQNDESLTVRSNLALAPSAAPDSVTFASSKKSLPAGQLVQLHLGRPSTNLMAYGRWVASATLIGLIGATTLLLRRPRSGARTDS